MNTAEIMPLTKEAVRDFLLSQAGIESQGLSERRTTQRWPFPATVELWIKDDSGVEQYALATCVNLSLYGLGILYEDTLLEDEEVGIAIHEPEVSFHGRAIVRHCTSIDEGYYVGLRFEFPS